MQKNETQTVKMAFPVEGAEARYSQLVELFRISKKMTDKGIRVDRARALWHIGEAQRRRAEFTEIFLRVTKLSPRELGDSGSGQTDAIRDYFWKTLNAPPVVFDKRTKKPQFNTPTLVSYATDKEFQQEPLRTAAAALLGIRKAITAGRFAEAYVAVSDRHNGRIHFRFNPLGTKGTRWSSSAKFRWRNDVGETVEYSLNAQNIPNKVMKFDFGNGPVALTTSQRDCFIPDQGYVWMKWDGDQAEARLLAYTCGAQELIAWIDAGNDLHLENARIMWEEAKIPRGLSKDDPRVKKGPFGQFRDGAKPCMYALSYSHKSDDGKSHVKEVFKQLKTIFPDLSEQYLGVMVERFFKVHHEIVGWQEANKTSLRETGKIVLPSTGDFLYLPATMRGFNQAGNFQMQSGLGAIVNRGLINADKKLTPDLGDFLGQVHDELDAQVVEKHADYVDTMVSGYLSEPIKFANYTAGVPFSGDKGPNWADVKGKK